MLEDVAQARFQVQLHKLVEPWRRAAYDRER